MSQIKRIESASSVQSAAKNVDSLKAPPKIFGQLASDRYFPFGNRVRKYQLCRMKHQARREPI